MYAKIYLFFRHKSTKLHSLNFFIKSARSINVHHKWPLYYFKVLP